MQEMCTTLVPDLVSSLLQPTEPIQRVHINLFGPLKTTKNGKKFMLCIIDAFTKYIQLVTLPNKEATTMSAAIFNHRICHFVVPVDLITDQGKIFCTRISEDLFILLGLAHLKMTTCDPQTDSQAKVANKTIPRYLVRNGTSEDNYRSPTDKQHGYHKVPGFLCR
jgi:hypothetical protein